MTPIQSDQLAVVGAKSDPRGTSESLRDPQKGLSGPKWALLGPPWGPGETQYWGKVCGNHNSNPVGPIGGSLDQIRPPGALQDPRGPSKGPFGAKMGPFWAPWGPEEA